MDAVLVRPDPDPFAGEPVAAGYRAGDLVFLPSLAATGADGRLVGAGDFDAQAAQVMRNLAAALAHAWSAAPWPPAASSRASARRTVG